MTALADPAIVALLFRQAAFVCPRAGRSGDYFYSGSQALADSHASQPNIEYVQQQGATRIVTNNEENNPMYQINVQFGFKPRPGWLEFHKKLTEELES